jgi:hypothetical protein
MMLKLATSIFAACAVLLSLAAYGAGPATDNSAAQPARQSPAAGSTTAESPAAGASNDAVIADEIATNPGKFVQAAIRANNMGYLFASVYNPNNVALARVFVVVLHFDEATRQQDKQSNPMLVAARLAPGQSSQIKLEGLQVFKQAELDLYRVVVVRAELAR